MSALIKKYIDFFQENGCTDFCVGGDEFAAHGATDQMIGIAWVAADSPDSYVAVFRKIPENLSGMPGAVKFRNHIDSII